MGQAPSTTELPQNWGPILENLTREEILRAARKCRVSDKSVYSDEDHFDLDDHVPMALEMLNTHPHLKDVRFKLVPGRMSEETFWAAVFEILNESGTEEGAEDPVGSIGDDYETGDEMDGGNAVTRTSLAQSPHDEDEIDGHNDNAKISKENGSGSGYDELNLHEYHAGSTVLKQEIQDQNVLIARLQKSLREANHKIRKLGLELEKEKRSNHKSNPTSSATLTCPKCNATIDTSDHQQSQHPPPIKKQESQQRPHRGQWEMHPDCKEFLRLDSHLKDNLRKEKEKRVNEVMSQMKFILDSEHVKDTYGKWSCCGKEEYGGDGCA